MSGAEIAVSVVIPALNEERNIVTVLQALVAQTMGRDKFEVIVADHGSTDRTVAAAAAFIDRLNLKVVSQIGGTIGSLRNFGAATARGQVLAFLDSDCFPKPDWLATACLLGNSNDLWGAHYRVPEDGTWVGKTWTEFQAKEQQGKTSFIPGGDLFLYQAAFKQLGGFSTSAETSEDVDLSERARQQGMQVLAYPSIAVMHAGTARTLKQFYRQNRWHGKHVVRVFLASLPRITRTSLPILVLTAGMFALTCLTIVAAVAGLLYGHWAFAITAFCLWLVPPTALSIVRAWRRPAAVPGLFLLYGTYLLARMAALVQVPGRNHR